MKKVVIIGAGPGGYAAALRGSALGLEVTLIEKEHLGGTCLNWGCIPTKTYYHTTKVLREAREAKEITGELKVDFQALSQKQAEVVGQLVGGLKSLMKSASVKVIQGEGRLTEDGVVVDGQLLPADNVIIATGATPLTILGIEPNGEDVFTAKEIWDLKEIPSSMVILGGGVIGVEFATIFSQLGSKVTIVEREKSLLPQVAPQASRLVARHLKEAGVVIKTNTSATGYEKGRLKTEEGYIAGDILLVALGNRPNTNDLGLGEVGIALNERKEIIVDQNLETNKKGFFAIGDVNNMPYKLAHAASHQGALVAERISGVRNGSFNSNLVPRTVFTYPELAEVGVFEGQKSRFPFSANGRALASGMSDGFVEVYGDDKKLNGVLIVGPEACELGNLASYALATNPTKENLKKAIMTHPTLGETFSEASLGLFGEAIHMIKRR